MRAAENVRAVVENVREVECVRAVVVVVDNMRAVVVVVDNMRAVVHGMFVHVRAAVVGMRAVEDRQQ